MSLVTRNFRVSMKQEKEKPQRNKDDRRTDDPLIIKGFAEGELGLRAGEEEG